MPDWMYILPSGLMTNRPSNPVEPATNVLTATPTPRTFEPTRWPDCAFRSSHWNISAPLSSASFTNALVRVPALAARVRRARPAPCLPAR